MLGDLYLTLAWMAYQRLRYGNARPQGRVLGYSPPVITLLRPEEHIEEAEAAVRRHE